MRLLSFPDVVQRAATDREPHLVTNYLRDTAADFHAYYNGSRFLIDEVELRSARLTLIHCARQVLSNGLGILGIDAVTEM